MTGSWAQDCNESDLHPVVSSLTNTPLIFTIVDHVYCVGVSDLNQSRSPFPSTIYLYILDGDESRLLFLVGKRKFSKCLTNLTQKNPWSRTVFPDFLRIKLEIDKNSSSPAPARTLSISSVFYSFYNYIILFACYATIDTTVIYGAFGPWRVALRTLIGCESHLHSSSVLLSLLCFFWFALYAYHPPVFCHCTKNGKH